jgi:hypothetical protein
VKNIQRSLVLGASLVALAGCGADEIVSPGTSGDINVTINNPAPTPTPTPTPTATLVTPAADCPAIASTGGLTDSGTITGPTGTYRVCTLPAVIDTNDALPFVAGTLYALGGRVDVGTDQGFGSTGTQVTLRIDPGVILYGATGRSFLVVNRGNELDSIGTATRPVVWTSRDNVLGISTDNSTGQWGGVVLLGRAPVSDCSTGGFNTVAAPNTNAMCEQQLEGTNTATVFGGGDDGDSSGTFTYNQIRYSGFSLAPGNELQSLTTGGVGSGTTFSHFMSFNSSDDGMEFFGGSVNMQYVAGIGADDDTFDVDTGAQANLQYVVGAQRTGGGDNLIELDSPDGDFSTDAIPQTVFQVANFTFLERSTDNDQAVRARGGAKLVLANGVIDTDDERCVRIDEQVTFDATPVFQSIVGDCTVGDEVRGVNNDDPSDALVAALFDANSDLAFTISLTGFVNGTNEDNVTAADPNALSSFFDTTTFIGAATGDGTAFEGWTCNSSTLDFGSVNGDCTSLPVF